MPEARWPCRTATGIGSLPHRDAAEAAELALRSLDLPAIPSLPRRSPAEGMIAQALVGLRGVTVGQYGGVAVDARQVDLDAPVASDLHHDAFVGFRSFLEAAAPRWGLSGGAAVKWQFVGPVTLGLALVRAGVSPAIAFDVANHAVRSHVRNLLAAVDAALSGCRQLVFLDEPSLGQLMNPDFPIAPERAIDLVSASLAAIEPAATAGLHCCGAADRASLIAAGPSVLSVPVDSSLVDVAGSLARFQEHGGIVAWGAVPTSGPIPTSAERPWRRLSDLWSELAQRGCDADRLWGQGMITPECGLGMHTPQVAERVYRLTAEVATRARELAASRSGLGA